MVDPILIIGGGIGGLSAAIHLAAAGKRVLVLEQNTAVGGKMSEWASDGFRWDTGPSVITMRHVLEELFHAAGKRLEDYLTLLPVEPLTRYFFPDGTLLDFTRDLPTLLKQIEQIDKRDVEGFLKYLSYVARLHRITGPVFIYDEPPHPSSLLKVHPRDMLHVDAWRSMDHAIRSFVHSPQLRQLLGRFATYVGASPYRAPATLNVIAHVELNGGVWYPQGGIYAIARAMERLALELGVEIRTGTRIDHIQVKDRRATGVTLSDGRTIAGEAVIANVDVATVYEHLLPRTAQSEKRLRKLSRIEPSCSGFILMLGIEGEHPQLAHHNIFFSRDYPGEFRDIFERRQPPGDPTIYVAITSKTDPAHAPQGHENWFVLVNAPACTADFNWTEAQNRYSEVVLNRLKDYGLDIRRSIRVERILTPADLERMTGARRGALYGSSSNNPLAAFLRPHNRDPLTSNLYYAGGTTHPGGGVPMVTLSGKLAAKLILKKA